MPRPIRLIPLVALWAVSVASASGEVFVLKSGGQVEGELLNPNQSPRESFVVRTTSGARVTLGAEQVRQKLHQRPVEIEYERVRPQYPDTVQGQWALSQWCLEHHLVAPRREHLQRVIELDADHVDARHAL